MQGPSQVQPVLQLEAASKAALSSSRILLSHHPRLFRSGHCGSHAQWQVRSDGHRHLLSLLLIPASSVGCRARSPFFQGNAKYPRPVPQSLPSGIFHFLHGSTLKYGVRQVSPPARQIHSTSHRQTLLPGLLPQKSCVLF